MSEHNEALEKIPFCNNLIKLSPGAGYQCALGFLSRRTQFGVSVFRDREGTPGGFNHLKLRTQHRGTIP
ncbi:hypothetical protein [Novosphingobium sp.]|uniref:hypothetical protein n=1 Tax=Novosphingobium sp. TaxID=1874826 RepID=UPI003D10CF81